MPGSILSAFIHTRKDSTQRERKRRATLLLSLFEDSSLNASKLPPIYKGREWQRLHLDDQGQFGHRRIKTCALQLQL